MKNQSFIQKFEYNQTPIRVLGTPENPQFVAIDLCNALGLTNSRKSLSKLDDDEKGVTESYTLGGKQKIAIVNESGMYTLILRSNKPEAKQFKRWITHEVLPSLRKTGTYQISQAKAVPAPVEKTVFEPNYLSEKVALLEKIVQLQEKLLTVPVPKPKSKTKKSTWKGKITEQEQRTILNLHLAGFSQIYIAKKTGRCRSSVQYWLMKMGAM